MEHKRTKEQTINALKSMANGFIPSADCEEDAVNYCVSEIAKDTLALIDELTEKNERLRAENARYEAENHSHFDKWLKLEEATKRHHSELFEEAKIVVKEETVRKMQERLKGKAKAHYFDNCNYAVSVENIDQIAKEMLEK